VDLPATKLLGFASAVGVGGAAGAFVAGLAPPAVVASLPPQAAAIAASARAASTRDERRAERERGKRSRGSRHVMLIPQGAAILTDGPAGASHGTSFHDVHWRRPVEDVLAFIRARAAPGPVDEEPLRARATPLWKSGQPPRARGDDGSGGGG